MPDHSGRFALPFLSAGQAQKELFHNEALGMLDLLAHAAVEESGLNTPPSSPAIGQCWIIGPSPTGAWAGHAAAFAGWTSGGWRFAAPRAGMAVWDTALGFWIHHDGSGWVEGAVTASRLTIDGIQVVASQLPAIAGPTGGSVIDTEARSSLALVLDALRTHGLIAA